jgi:DNA-binding NarL/FixJ family response regulator
MGGAETMRELRRLDVDVPVFVVSGQEQDELDELFAAARPEQFIAKPCDGDTILRAMRDWKLIEG